MERRYEHLPLSPILTNDQRHSLKGLLDVSVRENLWQSLRSFRDACLRAIATLEAGCEVEVTTTPTPLFEDGQPLTKHQEILGGVYILIDNMNLLDSLGAARTRLRGKARDHDIDRFRLLTIFAAASWVTLTEKCVAMPGPR